MSWFSNPKVVSKFPIASGLFFQASSIGHIYRIWTEHTAAGHNLWSWVCGCLGLVLFIRFYRVCCPSERFALLSTIGSIVINLLVILSIIWWRYIV